MVTPLLHPTFYYTLFSKIVIVELATLKLIVVILGLVDDIPIALPMVRKWLVVNVPGILLKDRRGPPILLIVGVVFSSLCCFLMEYGNP